MYEIISWKMYFQSDQKFHEFLRELETIGKIKGYIENIWYKKLKFPDQLALPNELIFYKLTKRKDLFKFRFPLENYTKEINTYAFMMFTWNLIAWLNSINLLED